MLCNINHGPFCPPAPADDQELLDAAMLGKCSYIVKLLARGANLHARHGLSQYTALHAAAECGQSRVVKLLIDRGADVGARLDDGKRPLHLAARHGHVAAMKALLGARASVISKDVFGHTALHEAAITAQIEAMRLLLDAGAEVNAKESDLNTSLHLCSRQRKQQAPALLLAEGADVAAICKAGYTPLHHASENHYLAVMRVLLGAGAPVNAVTKKGSTPLHLACAQQPWEVDDRVVEALISRGADLLIQDGAGCIALHYAAKHIDLTTCLLRANRSPQHVNAVSAAGKTPLHLASAGGNSEVAAQLVAAGADLDARDAEGCTPMHCAVLNKQLALLQQLLAAGADPGTADDSGHTLLHSAAAKGHTSILQHLLVAVVAAQGREVVDAVAHGMTALQLAVEGGHTSCVKLLLAAGADASKEYGAEAVVEGSNLAGSCVLHRVVQLGRLALVPLLATPANLHHVWQAQTPLHLALGTDCQPSMVQALMAAGAPLGVVRWVPGGVRFTAMSLAAGSKHAGLRALLPDMVRCECERYKQRQQGSDGEQQGQQEEEQQQPRVSEQQPDPMGSLACVAGAVDALLSEFAAAEPSDTQAIVVSCIQVVMEVLGGADASTVMQSVLVDSVLCDSSVLFDLSRGPGTRTELVLKGLSGACSAALEPLMQQRWRVTNRLQELVTEHLQQQQQQQQQQQGQWLLLSQPDDGPSASTATQLGYQALAAAAAKQWPLFVQLWEQLMGLLPVAACCLMSTAEQQVLTSPQLLDLTGLCDALLEAWGAARQQVHGRMRQELVPGVLSAVQAAGQGQPAAARRRGRRQQGS